MRTKYISLSIFASHQKNVVLPCTITMLTDRQAYTFKRYTLLYNMAFIHPMKSKYIRLFVYLCTQSIA